MLLSLRKLSLNLGKALHASKIVKTKKQAQMSPCVAHLHKASASSKDEEIPVKEIQIPISYGHVAAKAWGKENGIPIIALHGWMDNCGTFDRLIPLLDRSFYIVALDLPGHGLSSRKPAGCFYSYVDMILALKYVTKHLGWKKFNLMGHSMGGALVQLFTGFYPELIEKLVVIDMIKPISLPPQDIPENFARTIEAGQEIEKKLAQPPPVYTEQSALERLIKGMHNEITPESGKILLKRGTKLSPCGKGLVFTRDLRLRKIENYYINSLGVIQAFMTRITNEMLIIRANNTHPRYKPENEEIGKMFIALYRQHCKRFVLETVEGNHFVHLNNPERIAPLINNFILAPSI